MVAASSIRAPARRASARLGPTAVLGLTGAAMLAARLALIATTADVQTDAYGHFRIARALVADPLDTHVHWVWLPGWHYALWAMIHLGVGFTGVRVLSALIQAAAPFVLYAYCARGEGDERAGEAREVALVASLLLTIAPLANRLAVSAQAETCFALLLLACAWAIDARRFVLAGGLLAGACMLRYEAWGAIAALAIHRARRRDAAPGLASFLLPALAVLAWVGVRRAADGEWLTFVRYTQSFASGVRRATAPSVVVDALLAPLALPLLAFGPAFALAPLGLQRAVRPGWVVPGGVLAFLVASHLGRGALSLDRYLTALVPFACVAMAEGARRLPELAPRLGRRASMALLLGATAMTLVGHFGWLVDRARTRDAELRRYEGEVEAS
jgi:hypothetical protein